MFGMGEIGQTGRIYAKSCGGFRKECGWELREVPMPMPGDGQTLILVADGDVGFAELFSTSFN